MLKNNVEIRLYDAYEYRSIYPELRLDIVPDNGDTILSKDGDYYLVVHKNLKIDAYSNGHSLTIYLKKITEKRFFELRRPLPFWKRLFK